MKKHKKSQAPSKLSPAVLERVRERAANLASAHGLMVREVTFGPTDLGLTLSVVVASVDGNALSVTDCELISRPLSKELDELIDDQAPPYMFEVTSAGLETELTDDLADTGQARGGTIR